MIGLLIIAPLAIGAFVLRNERRRRDRREL
jgi:hypothetical protein